MDRARCRVDRLAVWGILGLVMSTSCTAGNDPGTARPSASPSPEAVRLSGTFVVRTDHGPQLLRQEPGRSHAEMRPLLERGVSDYAVSPNRRTMVYLTDGTLVLRDLASGAESTVTPTVGGAPVARLDKCLAWSPDSGRFSARAVDGTLFVVEPSGRSTVIDTVKRAQYRPPSFLGPQEGPITSARSEIWCGTWAGNDRLVFDRVSTMPASIATGAAATEHVVHPDTTTMAVLSGGTVRLVDSASRWTVVDQCGQRLLTRKPIGDDDDVYFVDGLTEQALATADGVTPKSGQLPYTNRTNGDTVRLLPDNCQLVQAGRRQSYSGTHLIRYLDPASRQPTRELPLAQPLLPAASFVWSPRQGDHTLAGLFSDKLHLTNFDTGTITTVQVVTGSVATSGQPEILAWLP
jgi:WD40 repeat protein